MDSESAAEEKTFEIIPVLSPGRTLPSAGAAGSSLGLRVAVELAGGARSAAAESQSHA
jgi:hypothetical protein